MSVAESNAFGLASTFMGERGFCGFSGSNGLFLEVRTLLVRKKNSFLSL